MYKNTIAKALILWLLLTLSACGSTAESSGLTATAEATSAATPTRASTDERAKGDLNAPVTLIEYGDYQ